MNMQTNIFVAHNLEENFDDPHVFMPDRFKDNNRYSCCQLVNLSCLIFEFIHLYDESRILFQLFSLHLFPFSIGSKKLHWTKFGKGNYAKWPKAVAPLYSTRH